MDNAMPGAEGKGDAARIEAWRQWHEQMAQRRMQRDRDYTDQDWMDRGRGGQYGRDRWSARDDYYDHAPAYQGRGRDGGGAMGYDDPRRWRGGPGDQSYYPDYDSGRGGDAYSDRGWRKQRYYDRNLEEGAGYTYRDDPYYQNREWDSRRYSRQAPGYYRDRSGQQDWGYRDRWGERDDWRGSAQGWRDDRRGGRWHGDRWGEGSGDTYDGYRGPQSRGQGMGDMTGRGWGYPDYYQGESGGPMMGERWQQGSQWHDGNQNQSQNRSQGQSPYPNQHGQPGAGSQAGSSSGTESSSASGAMSSGQPDSNASGQASSGSSGVQSR